MKNSIATLFIAGFTAIASPAGAQSSGVTFYTECGYSGASITFERGDYRMSDLTASGISNDSISSIKVGRGLEVTIFKHDKFGGKSVFLDRSESCLRDIGLDNDTSSAKIRRRGTRAREQAAQNSGQSNGYNNRTISFDDGRYEKTGSRIWTEYDRRGGTIGSYEQLSQRGDRLFLYDARREYLIDIDRRAGTVRIGPFGEQGRVQHRLNGGNYGSGTYGGGNTPYGGGRPDYTERGVTGQNISAMVLEVGTSRTDAKFVRENEYSKRWDAEDASGNYLDRCYEKKREYSKIWFDCDDEDGTVIVDLRSKTLVVNERGREREIGRLVKQYRVR